jgi:hypothetical protein
MYNITTQTGKRLAEEARYAAANKDVSKNNTEDDGDKVSVLDTHEHFFMLVRAKTNTHTLTISLVHILTGHKKQNFRIRPCFFSSLI